MTTTRPLGSPLDLQSVRADFPILSRRLAGGHRLVYLDSANSSQKPVQVIEAIRSHYAEHNANVARAMHQLGAEATAAYEGARDKIATFIGAPDRNEVVFCKNVSEGLNLAAHTLGSRLRPGDEVVISEMEHHSNIVPWQLACERSGATLRWFGVTDDGRLDVSTVDELINERTKVVSLTWVSNALGTINPIQELAAKAHAVGAVMVVDAAQAVPQLPVDVSTLGADLLGFTGHKAVGPTGIGVLWGRYELLAELPPFLGGGEMIETVRMTGSTYAAPPARFEAGTPPIAQAVGLGAAIDYLEAAGLEAIEAHEDELVRYALGRLEELEGVSVYGPPADRRGGIISFDVEGVHPHDVAQILGYEGIAVRAGHHCTQPLMTRLGVPATTRASFYLYTLTEEIDRFIEGLGKVRRTFA